MSVFADNQLAEGVDGLSITRLLAEDRGASAKITGRGSDPGDVVGGFTALHSRSIDLPSYSGPLDLLLKLIRKNEVDIYDIPIATITEQYLQEIEAMGKRDLVIAGDFLLMAATLLEIKSAMMLPVPPPLYGEDEAMDPRSELVQRLLEYQAYQEAAENFALLEAQRRMVFSRPFMPSVLREFGPFYPTAPNLDLDTLHRALQAMVDRISEGEGPVTTLPREVVSLRLRIAEIVADLTISGRKGLNMEALLRPQEGRLFVIVSFLAILETLRTGRIRMKVNRTGECRFWLARLEMGAEGVAAGE